MLEIYSLKEKKAYPVKGIAIHLHEKNGNCLIVAMGPKLDKVEIYESEYAATIKDDFNVYKDK